MVENTQATELLAKLESNNLKPIENQSVSDSGILDASSLLGARPGEESIIFEQLLSALPQPNEAPDDTPMHTSDTILGMDLS